MLPTPEDDKTGRNIQVNKVDGPTDQRTISLISRISDRSVRIGNYGEIRDKDIKHLLNNGFLMEFCNPEHFWI